MEQMIAEVISDKRSLPYNVAGTGTVVTHGIAVVGTGTLFKSEMMAGSYLVNLSTNQAVRVYRVDSDTIAFLEKPFTVDFASATPQIIPTFASQPKLISMFSNGDYDVNGNTVTGGVTAEKTGNDRSSRRDLIKPIVIDATAGSVQIEILY